MLNFQDVELSKIVVHSIGNKTREEGVSLSGSVLSLGEEVKEVLQTYFLKPFSPEGFYEFFHDTDLSMNEVYMYAKTIFNAPHNEFYLQSTHIARHLYEESSHPNIKKGELYIAYFRNCFVDGQICDALGLFKSENKETFLRVFQQGDNFQINPEDGVNINKLDKGCLIFNISEETGYKVSIVDKTNKTVEAQYWKKDFLHIRECANDSFHNTTNYLNLCKEFCRDVLTEENNADKTDQVALLQRSQSFFNNNAIFEKDKFEKEVIIDDQVIEAFNEYRQGFSEQYEVEPQDSFEISKNVSKKSNKFFRSVIKLDKNFTLYVHGNKDHIERDFDKERGLKYYKLYYSLEA